MSDFNNEKEVKARKQHICELCRNKINIGETYVNLVGVWQGDFYSTKNHKRCISLLHKYLSKVGYGEYDLSEFEEWVYETNCKVCRNYDNNDCKLDKEPWACDSLIELREGVE